jgi:hypothetical protein
MKEINLQVVSKDTKTYTIRLKRNGVAVDISGWTLTFTAKVDFNNLDAAAVINKTIIFPTNAESASGIGYLELSSAETTLATGEYFYDGKLIDLDTRCTFLRGKLIIVPSIRLA